MKLTQKLMLVAIAGMVAAGCGSDYKKTKEGMAYKIFATGKGDKIKPGTLLKLHFKNVVGDSVVYSTFEHIPAYGRYDTTVHGAYDFIDILGEMRVGDSAVFVRSVDTLQKKGQIQYGGILKKGGNITGYLKVVQAFENETAITFDHDKELDLEKTREIADLQKYLDSKNIKAQKTRSGVFVTIEKEGTGAAADSAKKVSVNYTGTLMSGTKFDSNQDTAFGHVKPFEFIIGTGQVIPGWDEGIRLFKVGSKGKMYVPAMLAYGPQSQGDRMPAYSNLVFDIEVINVSEPGNAPGQFQTPGAIPPQ